MVIWGWADATAVVDTPVMGPSNNGTELRHHAVNPLFTPYFSCVNTGERGDRRFPVIFALDDVSKTRYNGFVNVYISADLEGISGVVHWEQCSPGNKEWADARALMTAEANAAIQGAFDGGATEVLVNDAHSSMRNLDPLELDSRVRLLRGTIKPQSMMEGINESFDAAILIGCHAGAGCNGVLSHTYDGMVHSLRLNSLAAGEITINSALAGYYGVPVALVTGDSAACKEALAVLGGVEAVAVKEPISRYSANCLNPAAAREKIRAAAKAAISRASELEPFTLEPPIRFELTFNHVGYADRVVFMPGTERLDPVTVAYQSEDFITTFRGFLTMLVLAESAK